MVAERGPLQTPETALFAVDQQKAESIVPLPPESRGFQFSPQARSLALALRRNDDRYDLRVIPLTEGVGEARYFARTVATFDDSYANPLWAPTGDELLIWVWRFSWSDHGHGPWLLVDTSTGKINRVDLPWQTIEAVRWEPQGTSLLVAADGALWRLNPHDDRSQRLADIPSLP